VRRDSAAAVAVAVELALQRAPDTIVGVFAADHVITRPEVLSDLCAKAALAAHEGYIVTLGITPDQPATGYGYIRAGEALGGLDGVSRVEAFVEKPNEETARRYVAEGYLWNSGNFIFRADVMKGELMAHTQAVSQAAAKAVEGAKQDLQFKLLDGDALSQAPRISIDYAVMEHTELAAVTPADMGWSDVGSWSAVHELSQKDADGNVIEGDGLAIASRNVLVRSPEQLTAVVGMQDVVVITTRDAVLVLNAKEAGRVKDLVEELKRRGRDEAQEHKRVYRPWGYYQSVDDGERYQVKRIVVKPHGKLSLQKHFHRAEHWVVVKGTALVTKDGHEKMVHENESIFLPIGCVHRLANPGKIDLELIEVQTGSYLGEDDIVRLDDVYHRS
jgi:mannose-1-phosphate guanylyltransferase/mannose-6-phosphate isomerase